MLNREGENYALPPEVLLLSPKLLEANFRRSTFRRVPLLQKPAGRDVRTHVARGTFATLNDANSKIARTRGTTRWPLAEAPATIFRPARASEKTPLAVGLFGGALC